MKQWINTRLNLNKHWLYTTIIIVVVQEQEYRDFEVKKSEIFYEIVEEKLGQEH